MLRRASLLASACVLIQIWMIALAAVAHAAPGEILPGDYVLHGDSGTLKIRAGKPGRLRFEIETLGGNCHSCEMKGGIADNVGRADNWIDDGSDSNCRISFQADGGAITVQPISEKECRPYCGNRASIDGTYYVPPTACTRAGRKASRGQFLRSYRAHRYTEAAATLQKMMAQCEKFMSWIELDQLRNDLALAQHHGGDSRQCLATLDATLASKVRNEKELEAGIGNIYLPPCDFEHYLPVAKATWFNQALCGKATR